LEIGVTWDWSAERETNGKVMRDGYQPVRNEIATINKKKSQI
jgi:hypothetical protein